MKVFENVVKVADMKVADICTMIGWIITYLLTIITAMTFFTGCCTDVFLVEGLRLLHSVITVFTLYSICMLIYPHPLGIFKSLRHCLVDILYITTDSEKNTQESTIIIGGCCILIPIVCSCAECYVLLTYWVCDHITFHLGISPLNYLHAIMTKKSTAGSIYDMLLFISLCMTCSEYVCNIRIILTLLVQPDGSPYSACGYIFYVGLVFMNITGHIFLLLNRKDKQLLLLKRGQTTSK